MPMDTHDSLAQCLADAQFQRRPLQTLPHELLPQDQQAAFAVQHQTLAMLKQEIAGWKVGAKSQDGPIQGAPLPADRLLASGASVMRADQRLLGLELEIAFKFNRVFEPFSGPHTEATVLTAIGEMLATIELVATRYAQWPEVDKLAQLADLQNHGALICGQAVPYEPYFPFLAPAISFEFEGGKIFNGIPTNPAGDPRRLLTWLVNHCVAQGLAIGSHTVITAGTYTGLWLPEAPGTVCGKIVGLPEVKLVLL